MHGTSAPSQLVWGSSEQAELFHNFLFVFLHHTQFELCPRLTISMLFTKRNLARCAIGPRMLYEFFVGLFVAMRLL